MSRQSVMSIVDPLLCPVQLCGKSKHSRLPARACPQLSSILPANLLLSAATYYFLGLIDLGNLPQTYAANSFSRSASPSPRQVSFNFVFKPFLWHFLSLVQPGCTIELSPSLRTTLTNSTPICCSCFLSSTTVGCITGRCPQSGGRAQESQIHGQRTS
jgi:hypothetical protein